MTSPNHIDVPQSVQDLYGDHFALACRQAAELMARPEYNGRLDKAVTLVLSGAVTLHEDGTAVVKSGSHTYHLEPECTCQDSQNRSLYCKHFLSVMLLKRTYERMGETVSSNGHQAQPEPEAPTPPQAPQSQAWECHQAPSSVTLKWASGSGIEVLLTLRDATDDALFQRIQRILPKVEAKLDAQRQQRQAQREAAQAEREAAQRAQATSGNGHTPPAATSQPPAPEADEDEQRYCDYHDEPLRRYTKDGRSWWSHKADDGTWCRGR